MSNEEEVKKQEQQNIDYPYVLRCFRNKDLRHKIISLLYTSRILTRQEIANELETTLKSASMIVYRSSEFFEVKDKQDKNEYLGLSEKGKNYVENTIKEAESSYNSVGSDEESSQEIQNEEQSILNNIRLYINAKWQRFVEGTSIRNTEKYLSLDLTEVKNHAPDLDSHIESNPKKVAEIFEKEIYEKFDTKKEVTFHNVPSSYEVNNLGEIDSDKVGKLVKFEANVIQKSEVEIRETESKYECPSCGTIISIQQLQEKETTPSKCSCGRKGGFLKVSSKEVNQQRMKLEEPYDIVDRNVKSINVLLRGFLASERFEHVKELGERVKVIGWVDTEPKYTKSGGTASSKRIYVRALNIEDIRNKLSDVEITDEDEREIIEFASSNQDPSKELGKTAYPNVRGYDIIKKAIMLQQIGGVKKETADGKDRGSIHMLLIGDPGTSKTKLTGGIKNFSPKYETFTGTQTSKAGLIGAVRKDEFTGTWVAEGGAMPRANGGTARAEELDKMGEEDREGLHDAMEEQEVIINKAGIRALFKTETSLLGTANPKFSDWSMNADLLEQFNLPSSLRGRFDLIFPIIDKPEKEKDIEVSKAMLNPVKEEVDYEFILKYVLYAKRIVPKMSEEVAETLSKYYSEIRQLNNQKRGLVTARLNGSIRRISEAIAKSRLSDEISESDVKEAVDLHKYCLQQLGIEEVNPIQIQEA